MLVSVYIRKADEDKWRKLPNKTELISKLLNGQKLEAVKTIESEIEGEVITRIGELPDGTIGLQHDTRGVDRVLDKGLCKHGASPKFCKFAKKGVCK